MKNLNPKKKKKKNQEESSSKKKVRAGNRFDCKRNEYEHIPREKFEDVSIRQLFEESQIAEYPGLDKFTSLSFYDFSGCLYMPWGKIHKIIRKPDRMKSSQSNKFRNTYKDGTFEPKSEYQFIFPPTAGGRLTQVPKGVRLDVLLNWLYSEIKHTLYSEKGKDKDEKIVDKVSKSALDIIVVINLFFVLEHVLSGYDDYSKGHEKCTYQINYDMEVVKTCKEKYNQLFLGEVKENKNPKPKPQSPPPEPSKEEEQPPAKDKKRLKSLNDLKLSGVGKPQAKTKIIAPPPPNEAAVKKFKIEREEKSDEMDVEEEEKTFIPKKNHNRNEDPFLNPTYLALKSVVDNWSKLTQQQKNYYEDMLHK